MQYTAVVIDNNLHELTQSVEKLNQCKMFKKVMSFQNVEQAIEYIDNNGCDVLFTEIELNKIDGFQLGRRYGGGNLAMCFVLLTNKENFALDAFAFNVTDFVLKPLEEEAINRIVKKVRNEQHFEMSGRKRLSAADCILENVESCSNSVQIR